MNILDHRILVPKSPQIVWEHLSDLSKNQTWQVNYTNVSFLTSKHAGTGVRWRYTTNDGHEYVAEITAWYDGLGYEYTLVDGGAYRENKGRIRLQEIPEGTIVQWTFSYDMGGFLGGVRNALSYKRQVEGVMVDSLKMLWRVLNQSTEDANRESKAILRAGLDYEARAQYKPRHPSVKSEPVAEAPANTSSIVEPPISDEDTRPRAPVVFEKPTPAPEPDSETGEPGFLVSLPSESMIQAAPGPELVEIVTAERSHSPAAADTSEHPVVLETPSAVAPEIQFSEEKQGVSDLINPPGTLPEQPVIVEIAPVGESSDSNRGDAVAKMHVESAASQVSGEPGENAIAPAPVVEKAPLDTAEVSVFDVFGLPKPSETQEMRAVTVPAPTSPVTDTVQSIAVVPTAVLPVDKGRTGMRIRLRRKRVRLRRPG